MTQVYECVLNKDLNDALRSNFAKLLISLHMDCDPLDKMNLPDKTRVYADYKPQDAKRHEEEALELKNN